MAQEKSHLICIWPFGNSATVQRAVGLCKGVSFPVTLKAATVVGSYQITLPSLDY